MTETVSALRTGDLECPLCLRIYWDPDVTPCGHTFCSNCLERTLDHDPKCPLCKQSLVEFLELRQGAKREDFTDKQLTRIIRRWLPEEHQDRFKAVSFSQLCQLPLNLLDHRSSRKSKSSKINILGSRRRARNAPSTSNFRLYISFSRSPMSPSCLRTTSQVWLTLIVLYT